MAGPEVTVQCDWCRRTVMKVVGEELVLLLRHGTEWHETHIKVQDLTKAQPVQHS